VKPLRLAAPDYNDTGAVLGYPGDGPFNAEPARVGSTSTLFSPNYAGAVVSRSITSLRGKVRPGDSGGPVVNENGAVELTVFGAKKGTDVGYGTSSELARALLGCAIKVASRPAPAWISRARPSRPARPTRGASGRRTAHRTASSPSRPRGHASITSATPSFRDRP